MCMNVKICLSQEREGAKRGWTKTKQNTQGLLPLPARIGQNQTEMYMCVMCMNVKICLSQEREEAERGLTEMKQNKTIIKRNLIAGVNWSEFPR